MSRKLILLFSVAILFISSCKKDENLSGIFKGPAERLYNGKTWTWNKQDENGIPQQIGVVIDDAALKSVPVSPSPDHHKNSWLLRFNSRRSSLPFTNVVVDWNPKGYNQNVLYTRPHFAFHFYMINEAERQAIPDYEDAPGKFKNFPESDYLPANYVNFGGGDAEMGTHWPDITSPELRQNNPQSFRQSIVFGSFNGNVISLEPMITLDFLKIATCFEREIPQPVRFKTEGYYPSKLRVVKRNGTTELILDGFKFRAAS